VPMSAKLAFALVLAASSLFAQNPAGTQTRAANATGSPTIVMPPPVVYIVPGGYGGYYTGYYGPGAGAYLAPTATLPVQNTGISLANQAGISLSAPLQTAVSTAVPATSGYGVPAQGGESFATSGEEAGRQIIDLGPSAYAGDVSSNASAPSLGEIAAEYKTGPTHNVRMYTNEDAARITSGVKTGKNPAPDKH